jgi:ribonuclease Z
MARLIVLGASNAVGSVSSSNTHIAIETEKRLLLIDAANDPVVRLQQAGLDPLQLSDLILTHFHPDHVGGVPSLLMTLWLLGRKKALHVYGLPVTLDRVRKMLDLYDWQQWPNFFPIQFHEFSLQSPETIIKADDLTIQAAQVKHIVPTMGLRVTFQSGKAWAYSCDTEPYEATVRLAGGADVFFHEASGKGFGHSSAEEAAQIARRAEVGEFYLIHYETWNDRRAELKTAAEAVFGRPVKLAEDFMTLVF